MKSIQWQTIVRSNGKLNTEQVRQIEILYTGLHGQSVQRFWLNDGSSYIYKPLPSVNVQFRELRSYRQVMPLLPAIYPRLFAYGAPAEELNEWQWSTIKEQPVKVTHLARWMIIEDIGEMDHHHTEAILQEGIAALAQWQQIDPKLAAPLPQEGQKPILSAAYSDVAQQWQQVKDLLQQAWQSEWQMNTEDVRRSDQFSNLTDQSASFPLTKYRMNQLQADLKSAVERIHSLPNVLLHGDLHPGNFGTNPAGRFIVLDWEHSHIGCLFWDLYHLIDLSHPLFPRRMTPILRSELLYSYWLHHSNSQPESPLVKTSYPYSYERFKQDYMLYSIIYSLWMLLLIERDLQEKEPIWPRSQLLAQRYETAQHLWQCVMEW